MRTPRASRDAAWLDEFLALGAALLVGLAAAEFLLLRILNRVSGAFPEGIRSEAAQDIALAGTFAYNGAFLGAALLLLALGWRLAPRDPAVAGPLLAWLPALLAAQVLGRTSPSAILLAGLVAVACLLAPVLRSLRTSRGAWRARSPSGRPFVGSGLAFSLFLLSAAATFLAAMYLHLGDVLGNLGAGPPGRVEAYAAGEALALASAFLAATAFPARPKPWNVGIPLGAAGVLGAWFLVRPELVPLVAYWSLGFQVQLPALLYVAGVAAFLAALVNAGSVPRRPRTRGYGLVLLGLAGRQLADLYLVQLAILSLVLVALPGVLPHAAEDTTASEDQGSVPGDTQAEADPEAR